MSSLCLLLVSHICEVSYVSLSLFFFLAGTEIHLITAQACEVVGTVVKNGMQWTNPEVIHFSPSE